MFSALKVDKVVKALHFRTGTTKPQLFSGTSGGAQANHLPAAVCAQHGPPSALGMQGPAPSAQQRLQPQAAICQQCSGAQQHGSGWPFSSPAQGPFPDLALPQFPKVCGSLQHIIAMWLVESGTA